MWREEKRSPAEFHCCAVRSPSLTLMPCKTARIQASCFLSIATCSPRQAACNAGVKSGPVEDVHRLMALLPWDPTQLACCYARVRQCHGVDVNSLVFAYDWVSFPRQPGDVWYVFFPVCVKSHEFQHESYDVWIGFKDFPIVHFSILRLESFIRIVKFCCCLQWLPTRQVISL